MAFLAARLDEDEAAVADDRYYMPDTDEMFSRDRVRRDVAAKRAILGLHRIEVTYISSLDEAGQPVKVPEVQCYVCGWASDDASSACETLRHLAAVYSDHPGYRAEWKP